MRTLAKFTLAELKAGHTITQAVTMDGAGTGRSTMRPRSVCVPWFKEAIGRISGRQRRCARCSNGPACWMMLSRCSSRVGTLASILASSTHSITVLNEPFDGVQQAKMYRYQKRKGRLAEPVTLKRVHAIIMSPGISDVFS